MSHTDAQPAVRAAGELQRVLLVDDAPDVHDLVRVWLMEEALVLDECFDGAACLAAAGADPPDLILLDVDLPGTDGFAVCRALKADPRTADVPVIFLTGASSSEEKLQGLELGATDYVTKPFDPAELRARVRAALRTRWLMDLLELKATGLQQSEEEYRATFELASVGKAQVEAGTGRFLRVNDKFCQITGYARKDLLDGRFADLLHPADRSDDGGWAGSLLRGEVPEQSAEHRCLRKDGQTVWVEVSAAPIRDAAGRPARAVCVVQDITARKRAETLEEVQREVLEMVAAGRPLEDPLRHLVRLARAQCDDMAAYLFLLRDGRFRLADDAAGRPDWAAVLEERSVHIAVEMVARGDGGPATAGAAAPAAGGSVVPSDPAADPVWRDVFGPGGPRAVWFSPVRAGTGDILGFYLLVGSAGPRLPTPFERELVRTIGRLATVAIEHRQMSDQMTHRAQHDALTGLPNRLLFEDRLQQAIGQAQRTDAKVALIYADLDRFKVINDTLGHHVGDQLLQAVVGRWTACLREVDTLARLGGDEFAVVLPGLRALEDAAVVAHRLLESLKEPLSIAGHALVATSSMGVALFPADGRDVTSLQQSADAAMYRTKRSGRNGFRCAAPEANAAAAQVLDLEAELRGAADRGEMRLHYQPVVDRDRRLVGFEALLRWESPRFGAVSPGRFIPLAEETGMIVPLGAWVVREACRQSRAWADAGLAVPPVAVNVSALQFARPDFVEVIDRALADAGLPGDRLTLELTESVLMQGRQDLSGKLADLRGRGCLIAVDDFGTGYSSLAYLQTLPIDKLKIDRSFVADLAAAASTAAVPSRGAAIVRAVISMAHNLGMKVVAEGVETDAQADFLLAAGCDTLQGFLFGQPATATKAAEWLAAQPGPVSRTSRTAA